MTTSPLPPPAWTPPPGPTSFTYQDDAGLPRRRAWRTVLVAIPSLIMVAGATALITILVTGGGRTTTGSGSPAAAPLSSAPHATVGTLTAQNGSTWTVRTARGATISVEVGSGTRFGTKAHPSQAGAFHDGTKVRVVGTKRGSTLDAKRVELMGGTSSAGGSSA